MNRASWKRLLKNVKVQLIVILLLLSYLAAVKNPFATTQLFAQLTFSALVALCSEWLFFGNVRKQSVQSSLITGLIVGMLLLPGVSPLIVLTATFSAIALKRFVRIDGHHIFNPAASGLIVVSLIWGNQINWWGFSSPMVLIIFVGLILYRLSRLSAVFSYIIFRCISACFAGDSGLDLQLFSLANLFFAFVMLIEPKTSPKRRRIQWIFGGLAGCLATLYFHVIPGLDGDLLGLLSVNLLYAVSRGHKAVK